MKASKLSDAQKAFIMQQGWDGVPVADICRRAGISHASPLVLDLDGDGVEISTRFSRSVYFDIDNDGIKERSNWVLPDDGLLALDRNGNGVIDDANELFGALIAESERQIPHFVYVEATCH